MGRLDYVYLATQDMILAFKMVLHEKKNYIMKV